jgi:exodeoxyribonuclease-3
LKKNFLDFLKTEKPDILCLQETKIAEKDIAKQEFDFPGYDEYWNPAERPGYSGTALLVKSSEFGVKNCKSGFGIKKFDKEGRAQTLDLGKYYVVNTYFPNANHELSRLDYKIEFNNELLKYLKKLENSSTGSGQGKPVIICGDFNVAHEPIDLARPKDNEGSAGFTLEEREWMTKFLHGGFVDVFRAKYPDKIQYTWWSYRSSARQRNIGWRIDYFCVSAKLMKNINKIKILDKVPGSDHCPVCIDL